MMTNLPPTLQEFVLHWGKMGARWGVNRTVAQIHALLIVSPQPLHAEEIAETLSVARSNVSTSLRELQAWGLVKVVHLLGDRRDHFEAIGDVWEMFQVIIEERKRREVEPTLAVLRRCTAEGKDAAGIDPYARDRLLEMLAFFEMTTSWYDQVRQMPRSTLTKFVKMGQKVATLLKAAP
jgi:DNA-binding transcriptional regulator GbsR (MarR family)